MATMIIALAGLDGAGKTTITRRLEHTLTVGGVPSQRVDRWDILDRVAFPCARFIEADLRELRTCVAEMPVSARLRFLTWAMALSLEPHITEFSRKGVIILDSYWFKHAAVEVIYGADMDLVRSLVAHLPRPDFVFYLTISPEYSLLRRLNDGDLVPYECGMDPECRPESFLAHQMKVAAMLETWAERDGWVKVDATQGVDDSVGMITKAVTENLSC